MLLTHKFIVSKLTKRSPRKKLTILKFFRSFNWIELLKQETGDFQTAAAFYG